LQHSTPFPWWLLAQPPFPASDGVITMW
jgi:hypothetical protein